MENYVWDVIQILLMLLISSGVFIVKQRGLRTDEKIADLSEDLDRLKDITPVCRYSDVDTRIGKVEKEQKETRPILLDIRTILVKVQTDIEWMKGERDKK